MARKRTVHGGVRGRVAWRRCRSATACRRSRHGTAPSEPGERRQLLDAAPEVFARGRPVSWPSSTRRRSTTCTKIGELTVERDFFRRGLQR